MGSNMRILEDFYAEDFALAGIHTSREDFSLVYALNKTLKLRLRRAVSDLSFSSNIFYPYFEWKDELYDRNWSLLTNSCITQHRGRSGDLFPEEPSFSSNALVPEYKGANYLLKTEEDVLNSEVITRIKSIPGVITAYVIETVNLKSKTNLIF